MFFSQSSSDNNLNERWRTGQGGVSLFLKKSLNARVFEYISDRIITASFKLANTKVVVVVAI